VAFVIVPLVVVPLVILAVFKGGVCPRGCIGLRVVFDCIDRTQRFAFHALCAPYKLPNWSGICLPGALDGRFPGQMAFKGRRGATAPPTREMPHLMVSGFGGRVKPAEEVSAQEAPRLSRYSSVTRALRT